MRSFLRLLSSIIVTFFWLSEGLVSGLSVSPGSLHIQGVPIGEVYELEIPITIHNRSEVTRSYLLSICKPSQIGAQWPEGYLEIPQEGFLSFEPAEVTVPPNGLAEVKIYLSIPDEERYYNQHWVALLEVKSKPKEREGVILAAYPSLFIETVPKKNLAQRPDGSTGVRPSQIFIEGVPLGITEKITEIEIYNNDDSFHIYKIIPFSTKKGIGLSDSYEPIPDPGWIVLDRKEIRIEGGESGLISLGFSIPSKSEFQARRWEGIVLVKPEQGDSVFIRVKFITAKE